MVRSTIKFLEAAGAVQHPDRWCHRLWPSVLRWRCAKCGLPPCSTASASTSQMLSRARHRCRSHLRFHTFSGQWMKT